MTDEKLKLFDLSFKSSVPGSYNKAFGIEKDGLRARGFPLEKTSDFIERNVSEKSIKKLDKNIPPMPCF